VAEQKAHAEDNSLCSLGKGTSCTRASECGSCFRFLLVFGERVMSIGARNEVPMSRMLYTIII
jgi:hypothetical protein